MNLGRPTYYDSDMVIVLEDVDFIWYDRDIQKVKQWWVEGKSIWWMGEKLKRNPDEVALLIMDMARRHLIQYRSGGAYGFE